jgi:hypothetical protein
MAGEKNQLLLCAAERRSSVELPMFEAEKKDDVTLN